MKTRVHVGVFAHDEEASLEAAVSAVLDQRLDDVDAVLGRVTVVSCASRDRTDDIARALAERDGRVHLLANPRRRGKAHAINRFLAHAHEDVVVLVGGDVVLAQGALARLLRPLADPGVGMTGVRPVPRNAPQGIGALVHLLWELHDRCARESPKLGEAIALRRGDVLLPDWSRADEVSLEADVVVRRGLRLVYCADAIAYNRGPERLADYVEHRTRIAAAHHEIERRGYRAATRDVARIARHAFAFARENPARVPALAVAAAIEAWAWIAGAARARPTPQGEVDGTWRRLESAKRPVARPDAYTSAAP